jgi:fatty-acyl-CoA synthase
MAVTSYLPAHSERSALHPGIIAAQTPERTAVVAGPGDRLTYGDLDRDSDRLAGAWRARGVRPGDVVALLIGNSSRFFSLAWAAQRSGLYYVALPTSATPEEIAYVLDDAAPIVLALDATFAARVEAAFALQQRGRPSLIYAYGEEAGGFESLQGAIAGGPFVAYDALEGSDMLYTSGTTGRPKGVKPSLGLLPLGNDQRRTDRARRLYGFDEASVFLIPAPLYHAAPLRFGMTALRLGATLVVLPKFSAQAALDAMTANGVTHSQWVPTMFARLLALPEETRAAFACPTHRLAMHSGGPCSIAIKRRMIDWWGPILYEYYSGSESVGFTHADSAEWLARPGTVGKAFGCTVRVLDGDGREVAPGEIGTIYFESAHRLAYHNDAEKTLAALDRRGWATMGDIGYLDAEGYLFLTGRHAFTIVSGGVNVYPREIEIALESHRDVVEAAAFGVPDDDLGERVHAVVAVAPARLGDPNLSAELLQFARERLAPAKLPKAIEVWEELPHLASGKLDKRGLRAQVLERTAAQAPEGASHAT